VTERGPLELVRLAVEIERKLDRIHPTNRHDGQPVTVKITRTVGEFKAITVALVRALPS